MSVADRSRVILCLAAIYAVIVGAALLVAIDPAAYHGRSTGYLPLNLRISQTITLIQVVIALVALAMTTSGPATAFRPWLGAASLYGLVVGVSAAVNSAFDYKILILPGLVVVVGAAGRAPRGLVAAHLRIAFRFVTVGSIAMLITGGADDPYLFAEDEASRFFGRQLAGLTAHPNTLGYLAATSLILEMYTMRTKLTPIWLVAAGYVVVVAQSRSGWLAALTGIIVWAGGRFGRIVRVAVVGAVVLAFLLLRESLEAGGATGRERVWSIAWQTFLSHPVLGAGSDGLTRAAIDANFLPAGQAHNQFFDSLARVGIIGFAVLVAFLALAYKRAAFISRSGSSIAVAVLAMFTARCISESPMNSAFALIPLVAVLAAAPELLPIHRTPRRRRARSSPAPIWPWPTSPRGGISR